MRSGFKLHAGGAFFAVECSTDPSFELEERPRENGGHMEKIARSRAIGPGQESKRIQLHVAASDALTSDLTLPRRATQSLL